MGGVVERFNCMSVRSSYMYRGTQKMDVAFVHGYTNLFQASGFQWAQVIRAICCLRWFPSCV